MLKAIVDSLDNVPEELKQYYTEKNGKFELTGEGIVTAADVARVQEGLRKERNDHKELREKITANLGDVKIEDVRGLLDKIPELELAAKGNLDTAKVDEIVQSRIKSVTAPLERKLTQTEKDLSEARDKIGAHENEKKTQKIKDRIVELTTGSNAKFKVVPEAIGDIMLHANGILEIDDQGEIRTKDGVGVTPGLGPDAWLSDTLASKPHWCLPSEGIGAGGSGGNRGGNAGPNPFSFEHWNLTEQGKIYISDKSKAEQLAKLAGTTIGGARPAPKK